MGRLTGLNAMITGAASGFGRGIAEAFAKEGASVLVTDLNADGAQDVAKAISENGGTAEAMVMDITDMGSLEAGVAQAEKSFGSLSTMVANAGIGQRPARASETPVEEMRRQVEVNAIGPALTCQAAIPALRRHGGGASIIITVSAIALTARPEFCAYGMAKTAASYFMKSLALDLAPEGIRVNGLYPGVSDTPMFGEFSDGDFSKAAGFAAALPMGRMPSPADVGAAAVFLASPIESAVVTGVALPVDAGRTA